MQRVVPITSGSRTFAPGERFTVKSDQFGGLLGNPPFALKPVALYLGEVGVAWQIHDVRVNGRSQLDGDELVGSLFSPHGQFGAAQAVTSGFDTIAIGGTIELDVSFRETSGVERKLFYAVLFGVEVDPARNATEYSGTIRLRGVDGSLIAVACVGPSRVLPGESAWFVARSKELAFQPEHLVIDRCWPDWEIEDVRVDGRTQFVQTGPIPGELFQPGTVDTFVKLDVVLAARPFTVRARYVGSDPRGGRFGLVAYGKAGTDAEAMSGFVAYGEAGAGVDAISVSKEACALAIELMKAPGAPTFPKTREGTRARHDAMGALALALKKSTEGPPRIAESILKTSSDGQPVDETRLATISRASVIYERRVRPDYECRIGIQDPAQRSAVRAEMHAAFIAGALYSAESEADRRYTSWDEIVCGADLRAALDPVRQPYGTAGETLARRALAGDAEAVDAFASRRRVTLVQITKDAGFNQKVRRVLLDEETRLQDDDGFRRDRLAAAIRTGILAVDLGSPLSDAHRTVLEACAYDGVWIAGASDSLPGAVGSLLSALDAESRLLGPRDEAGSVSTESTVR